MGLSLPFTSQEQARQMALDRISIGVFPGAKAWTSIAGWTTIDRLTDLAVKFRGVPQFIAFKMMAKDQDGGLYVKSWLYDKIVDGMVNGV